MEKLHHDELPDEVSINVKTEGNLEENEDYILRKGYEKALEN